MKRYVLCLMALALAVGSTASASTRTYFGFQIGISNAPPPPVVYYASPPPLYYEPETRVYIVRDSHSNYDTFRYGSYWYVCDDDYWYRARSYRGPFIAIDVRSVPNRLFEVPQHRWHRYPYGLARWHSEHGRGHSYGHYKAEKWGKGGRGGKHHHDH